MAVELTNEIKEALSNPKTLKILGTVDKNGVPHITYKGSLHINEEGNLEHYELLESSQTNANLVATIWFDKKAAVNLLTEERQSYQLLVRPIRSITAGRYFESVYKKLRSNGRDIDLGAIWQFEVLEIRNETSAVRIKEDEEAYPILKHLDRLARKDD